MDCEGGALSKEKKKEKTSGAAKGASIGFLGVDDNVSGFKVSDVRDRILREIVRDLGVEKYGDELAKTAAKEMDGLTSSDVSTVVVASTKFQGVSMLDIVRAVQHKKVFSSEEVGSVD